MEAEANPYAPGAGRIPAALVGRQKQLEVWTTSLHRVTAGRDARSLVLYGLRGVGKTVLLTRFAQSARRDKWMVAQVEAGATKSLRQLVADQFQKQLADIARPGAGRRAATAIKTLLSFARASVDMTSTWSFGLNLADTPGGGADTGLLEADLGRVLDDLADAAEEQHVGVALLIDEAQNLTTEELAAICQIIHGANQRQARLLVTLAGLPSLPGKLAEAKSYAERLFDYHMIGTLSREEAFDALAKSAAEEGVTWSSDAIDIILDAAGGYPYFLQQFGNDTWNAADRSPLTASDARIGLATGWAALDSGFFRAQWDRATHAERGYLRAMAAIGDDDGASGEIASQMGRSIKSLGPIRASLINKGIIYAPEHGRVAFSVPAMSDFVSRQVP